MTKFYDAMLFPHADIPNCPRVGRFHPQTIWRGTPTETLPTHKQIEAAIVGQESRPIYYWDEFQCDLWDNISPSMVQATMDRRAALLQLTCDVVGPGPRLLMANFPIFGDMALRNILDPNYYAQVHAPQAVNAVRMKFDIARDKLPAPSKLYGLLGGAAVEMYADGLSSQFIPWASEREAFAACVENMQEITKASGLKMYPFILPTTPEDILHDLMRKFDDFIVWSDEIPVADDAPLLKRMRR